MANQTDTRKNLPYIKVFQALQFLSKMSTDHATAGAGDTKASHFGSYTDGITKSHVGLSSKSSKQMPTGASPCEGLYWKKAGTTPKIAFFAVHYNISFAEHYLAAPLAQLGFGFLGWNTRYRGAEDRFILENAVDDIAAGAEWLKKESGAEKIVFIGNSGGGSLMAAYQSIASKDSSLVSCDAFIFLNAHKGRPEVFTSWLDASVTDEQDPLSTDPELDMYNPKNGPPYSQEFIKRYRQAQVDRNNRITAWAKKELVRLEGLGISDKLFPIYRSVADLRMMDGNIDPSDRAVPGSYLGDPQKANNAIPMLGRVASLRTWLSMWSLEESNCKLAPHAARLTVPTLIVQSTSDAGVYPSDPPEILKMIGSKDKELKMVPGGHFLDDNQEVLEIAKKTIADWVNSKL
ncbi:hypothetical protein LTR93_012070 [Exophiala xenobiotica]|nr:hypothetical protein LTR93_012070 [Exophiala xenobiotica]